MTGLVPALVLSDGCVAPLPVWVQAASFSVTGAEIPLLGQVTGVLVTVIAGAAAWTMVRGGVLARLIGGSAGLSFAAIAVHAPSGWFRGPSCP